jgi:hypothetical protein
MHLNASLAQEKRYDHLLSDKFFADVPLGETSRLADGLF